MRSSMSPFWSVRRFRVGSQSNRMGLRLQGDPVSVTSPPERLSTPVAPGAIQVAGGQLIVLGVACGTMGGYPHVAHVVSVDLDRLGQLKPGDVVQFRRVSLEQAHRLDQDNRVATKSAVEPAGARRPEMSRTVASRDARGARSRLIPAAVSRT